MVPCVGLTYKGTNLAPPMCKWKDLKDGTYNIADVLKFHIMYDEILTQVKKQEAN